MTIRENWENYREKVIPQDAPEAQIRDMRNTFYAGVATVMSEFNQSMDKDEDGSAACELMNGLMDECIEFRNQIIASRN